MNNNDFNKSNIFSKFSLSDSYNSGPTFFLEDPYVVNASGFLSSSFDDVIAADRAAKILMFVDGAEDKLGINTGDVGAIAQALKNGEDSIGRLKTTVAHERAARISKEQRKILENAQKFYLDKEALKVLFEVSNSNAARKELEDEDISVEKEIADGISLAAAQDAAKEVINNEDEEELDGILETSDAVSNIVLKQEIAKEIISKAKKALEEQSWAGWSADLAKMLFIPFYFQYKANEIADIVKTSKSWVFSGDTLEEIYTKLWALPPKEFKETITSIYNDIVEDNPQLAVQFLNGVLSFSTSDKAIENFFSSTEFALVFGSVFGKGVKAGMKTAGKLKFKSAIKANGLSHQLKPSQVVQKAGKQEEAGAIKALKLDNNPASPLVNKHIEVLNKQVEDLVGTTSIRNPEKFMKGVDNINLHSAVAERISQALKTTSKNVIDLLSPGSGLLRVERVSEDSTRMKFFIEETLDKFYTLRGKKAEDGVIDIEYIHSDETVENVSKLKLVLGHWETRTGFDSPQQAGYWATQRYKLIKGSYDIKERDGKFYIETLTDIEEKNYKLPTPDLLETESRVKKANAVSAIVKRILSAEASLGSATMEARKTVVYGQNKIKELAEDLSFDYLSMGKETRKRFNRFLDSALRGVDQNTGEQGIVFNNVGDLYSFYAKNFGVAPTEDEIQAYFKFRTLLDFDYIARNLAVRRDLAKFGVKRYKITLPEGMDDIEFNARIVDDVPFTSKDEALIAIIDPISGKNKLIRKNSMTKNQRKLLEKSIESGDYVVLQLATSAELPFERMFGRRPVHFAVVKKSNIQEGPLPFKLINYNPGAGHLVYTDNYYTKIPLVGFNKDTRKFEYHGEFTIASHLTEREAKIFSDKMDELLKIAKKNGIDSGVVKQFIKDNALPLTHGEFKNIFNSVKSQLRLSRTVFSLPDGDNLYEIIKSRKNEYLSPNAHIENLHESPWDLVSSTAVRFNGKRDFLINRVSMHGSEANPAFVAEPPGLLDPLTSLAKTVQDDSNLLLMRDYKSKAIEDFMVQFGDLVKNYDLEKHNIYEAFANPVWRDNADINRLRQAKSAWLTIKNLWENSNSAVETAHRFVKSHALNMIQKNLGTRAAELTNDYAVPFIKDPVSRLRSLAFHYYIGMFNFAQLAQQAVGFVHVASLVNPKVVGGSFIDAFTIMYRYYGRGIGNIIKKKRKFIFRRSKTPLDVSDKDFDEMYEALETSGFFKVGSEYADLDILQHRKTFARGYIDVTLEAGKAPFKAGERFTRAMAWSAAYREWKLANKTTKLTPDAIRQIMNRADYLVGSMSSASKNVVQENRYLLAIPTQFWTYQMHIAEQLTSNIIKNHGKLAQAYLAYSLMFGITAPISAITTIPLMDSFRKYLLEYDAKNGTDYADYMNHPFIGFVDEGLLGVLSRSLSDYDFNISDRLAPMGLQIWNPIMNIINHGGVDEDTKKEFFRLVIGASGNVVGNLLNATSPVLKNITYAARGDWDAIGMTPNDWINIGKTFAQADRYTRAAIWRAYGRYLTKYGEADIGKNPEYIDRMLVTLGFEPREISDTYLKIDMLKENRRRKAYWTSLIKRDFNHYLTAVNNEDEDAQALYQKRIAILLESAELTPYEKAEILQKLFDSHKDMIEEIDKQFFKAFEYGQQNEEQ